MQRLPRLMRRCIAVLLIACLAAGCETVPLQVASTPSQPAAPEPATPAMPRKTPVLGAGDQVGSVCVGLQRFLEARHGQLRRRAAYPMLGDHPVAGKTTLAVQEEIRAALTDFIKDPIVRVSVATMRPPKVNVLGEVVKPGVYSFTTPVTRLAEAIGMAGGMTIDAQQKTRPRRPRKPTTRSSCTRRTSGGSPRRATWRATSRSPTATSSTSPPLFMADAAREAAACASTSSARSSLFQNSVILLNPFIRALLHGVAFAVTNPIVITPNP